MRLRSLATVTILAVAVVPFLTSSALSADATVGEVFPSTVDDGCGGTTWFQFDSPGNAYRVPTNGVITAYTIAPNTSGASTRTLAFKVARTTASSDPETFPPTTIVGTGPDVTLNSTDTTTTGLVRISVRAGDLIGSYYSGGGCGQDADETYTFFGIFGNAGLGPVNNADISSGTTPYTGYQFSVKATVEADADGDGYGDTTQDKCATDATTQGVCPVVKDTAAPQTTVVSAKAARAKIKATKPGQKKKFKKAKVSLAFAATETSTYTCSVDGGAFAACANPFTVKLKKGTHTIAVRATDAAGNVDTTPAATTVTVKKAKNKKKP
jgi:hypothetical protein